MLNDVLYTKGAVISKVRQTCFYLLFNIINVPVKIYNLPKINNILQ